MDRKTRTSEFYRQMNLIIDRKPIQTLINRYYTKGYTLRGEKPYCDLVLFKMLLVGVWNKLSNEKTEDYVNESLSVMQFCGLALEDSVPDHSTLSRFRTELSKSNVMNKLLNVVNKELSRHNIIVNKGGIALL